MAKQKPKSNYENLSEEDKIKFAMEWLKQRPHHIKGAYSRMLSLWPYDENTIRYARKQLGSKSSMMYKLDKEKKKVELYNAIWENIEEAKKLFGASVTDRDEIIFGLKNLFTTDLDKLNQIKFRPDTSNALPRHYINQGLYVNIYDVHCPWHHKKFLDNIIKCLGDNKDKVVGICFGGDFADCNSFSMHEHGKLPIQGVTIDYEYDECEKLIDEILEPLSKNITKIFIYGNHEDRYFRHMRDVNHAKMGKEIRSPSTAMGLVKKGFDVYENWSHDYVTIGGHQIHHGMATSIHCAKNNFDKLRESNSSGHTHRAQMYVVGDKVSASCGWAGDKDAPVFNYASRSQKDQWRLSFQTIYIDYMKRAHINLVLAEEDGSFYFNGKFYK